MDLGLQKGEEHPQLGTHDNNESDLYDQLWHKIAVDSVWHGIPCRPCTPIPQSSSVHGLCQVHCCKPSQGHRQSSWGELQAGLASWFPCSGMQKQETLTSRCGNDGWGIEPKDSHIDWLQKPPKELDNRNHHNDIACTWSCLVPELLPMEPLPTVVSFESGHHPHVNWAGCIDVWQNSG